jgi:mannose-1-phosphate guanylyltransferase
MKAFLLGGGLGSRLGPLTADVPKCMVPINGTPLLEVWLQLCERHGIHQVLLNLSRNPETAAALVRNRRGSVDVTIVHEPHPVGNAGTVLAQRSFVSGEESFYILYSDNLTCVDLGVLLNVHRQHPAPLTAGLFRTKMPTASGIVALNGAGVITSFAEKPAAPKSDLANAGIYVARQTIFDAIPRRTGVIDFGHDVLPTLVGVMHGSVISDYLVDIGTPSGLARAREEWPGLDAINCSTSGEALS